MEFAPIVDGLEEEFGPEITFWRLNAITAENLALQQTYGVRGHPSVVILDETGGVVAQYFGPETAVTLRDVLTDLLD